MQLKEGFIICDSNYKNQLLKNNIGFHNYIYLSETKLINKLTIEINPKAIIYLHENFNISYSLAEEIIDNLKWIEMKQYNNLKLDSMVTILKKLKEVKLIKTNNLFPLRLKQYPLTFINPVFTKEHLYIRDIVEKYTEINDLFLNEKKGVPQVFCLNNITDEVSFVCNEIVKLLNKGVKLNEIFIAGADEKYLYLFKRFARNYNITMEFESIKNISSSLTCKQFLNLSMKKESYQEVLNELDKNAIYDIIINLIQEYDLQEDDPKKHIDFFNYLFKKTHYPNVKYTEAIHFINDSYSLNDNSHVFYVGFNLGMAPRIIKNNNYLQDEELNLLKLSTSVEKNKLLKDNLISFISNENVIITYKKYDGADNVYPSPLIKDLNLNVLYPSNEYGYSKIEDNLRLSMHYDNYVKFNEVHDELKKYGLQDVKYASFNHKFKGFNKDLIAEFYKEKCLTLSYSTVKEFFLCPFAFYASKILKLDEFSDTLATRLGKYSHSILENSYDPNFNFDKSVSYNSTLYSVDGKDRFYFNQMKNVLRGIIDFNRLHESLSELKDIKLECEIIVDNNDFIFKGFIDKLMYTIVDDIVYAVIVDYKTGKDKISLDNIEYGFNLQLPSYMYLLSNYDLFKGKKINIVGIYLQKVNVIIFDSNTDIEAQKEKSYRLQGYSLKNISLLQKFDPYFSKSTYIYSMSLNSNGFGRYAKVYNESQQNYMIELVSKLIDKANNDIKNGLFNISPKIINDNNLSCKYCKYSDICFCDDTDLVELEERKFEGCD